MKGSMTDEDYLQFNSEAFLRELAADLADSGNQSDRFSSQRRRHEDRIPVYTRSACGNPNSDQGLVERSQHYNQTIDRRVMTDARIAFEEEQLKCGRTEESDDLATSCQNIPKRGRGDYFGKMRSAGVSEADSGENTSSATLTPSSTDFSNNNNNTANFYNNTFKKTPNCLKFRQWRQPNHWNDDSRNETIDVERSFSYQPPRRFTSPFAETDDQSSQPRHHFNPDTAYKGKITPDFRFNYNPQATAAIPFPHVVAPVNVVYPGVVPLVKPLVVTSAASVTPIRLGQRYPKRPDNNPPQPSVPRHLNHNYYQIELYGATQEERIAQRIEKTVRQTEAPIRRF
ncbi:hypothetical protein GCK72_008705 [Caenorhabditis remanei]|uniref:Uncharacterized protein n=1 Tax=Caenorhabditis remanei TaxID=31234 RepID=A0A6A5H0Z6_CAERE|nr:hypothetical protein GCK72_008705 [Caenorhabditis remanei]KAF1760456.1 hypothetical protein GCK72_008705 [Caenorhabditis remanei]